MRRSVHTNASKEGNCALRHRRRRGRSWPARDFARTRSPRPAAPPVQNRRPKEARPNQAGLHVEQERRGGARSRAPATAETAAGRQRPPDPAARMVGTPDPPPARLVAGRALPMKPPLQIRSSPCRGRATEAPPPPSLAPRACPAAASGGGEEVGRGGEGAAATRLGFPAAVGRGVAGDAGEEISSGGRPGLRLEHCSVWGTESGEGNPGGDRQPAMTSTSSLVLLISWSTSCRTATPTHKGNRPGQGSIRIQLWLCRFRVTVGIACAGWDADTRISHGPLEYILAKEPVRCNGRENITHALNPTTITQDHNRSISFIFARHHICVAAYPPSHPRRRCPRCSHKTKKTCLNMFNPKASLSPSLLPLPLSPSLSLSLAFSHSRDEKSVVFPCDIFQRYARVVIDVFFSVYGYSGVFICNPDRRRYEKTDLAL